MVVWAVPDDALGCDALVFDPTGQLDADAVADAALQAERALGADVHVRAEGPLDTGLDARMAQLEAQCPTWMSGSERDPDLVVVMYSASEREASVFYGAEQADALESRWEHAVDSMGAEFAAGDFTDGVLAGLDALEEAAPSTFAPVNTPAQGGVPPVVWLMVAVIVVVAVVRVVQYFNGAEWATGSDSGWSSSQRRSTRGWSSSSRRSSGSRSSGSRRRAGGGTKKW